ncbi:hypothetical protein LJC17_00040 [Acholeplasma sp. OttesenSCG-928-E16]|nr:hypothetical protein [Acholeplasma sp. OttesenSCG-928-E16]
MKWVGRILYALALGIVTFLVYTMSNVSKIDTFKEDNLKNLHNDSEVTQEEIDNFVIAYAAYEKTEFSYHQMKPVYSFKGKSTNDNIEGDDKTSFNIGLSIYLVHLFNESNNVGVDALFFKIDNDFLVNAGTEDEPKIGMTVPILTIEFNEALRRIDDKGNVTIEKDEDENEMKSTSLTFSALYRGEEIETFYGWAFPAGLRKYEDKEDLKKDSFVEITRLEFKYINSENKTKTALSIVNTATTEDPVVPNPDAITTITEGTREFSLNKDNSFLSWTVSKEQAENMDSIYYVRFNLSGYNYIIIRNMLIYAAIALAITYLLFFNKHVVAYIREKKIQKEYDAIKDTEDQTEDKDVDTSQIFVDNKDTQPEVKKKRK